MERALRDLNAIGIIIICGVLGIAAYFQLVDGEMPCPLCLLQRIGLTGVLFGLTLNLLYGSRPMHYSLATLSALFGAATALRQVSLHVIPGTPGYGNPLMGYHYYTWALFIFYMIIIGIAIISAFGKQYENPVFSGFRSQGALSKIAIVAALSITAINTLITFAECGPTVCPDNPDRYWLFGST
ncbi:disulfide bond formation protein B [Microbulbifer sp. JMSA004]|uniref:disulfide bond formation protein B n=1 Tax=unclassified Microbulbifer TaxID=2619833 RepID=UPI0024AD424C|nr:disulfide bond formation protein B [Microbulbifer sp. VAAF005]WHI48370.1 disulfide bond formation protein B [Microbulbifer sp. VAAF005]